MSIYNLALKKELQLISVLNISSFSLFKHDFSDAMYHCLIRARKAKSFCIQFLNLKLYSEKILYCDFHLYFLYKMSGGVKFNQ